MKKPLTGLAGAVQATSTVARRLPLIATALLGLALLPAVAQAQDVPGSLVDAAQVERTLSQAMQRFSVDQGWDYAGDCSVSAPGSNQLCSEVFATDDGAVYVELLDTQHSAVYQLEATRLPRGTWRLAGDTVPAPEPA